MWRPTRSPRTNPASSPPPRIRDLRLRRVMAELDGAASSVPGCTFVCGWASAPPNECGGACILCRPDAPAGQA